MKARPFELTMRVSGRKAAKKIRKEARRHVDAVMGKGFEAVGNTMRKKPRFYPLALWLLPFYLIFPRRVVRYIRKYYKQG